MSISLRGRLFRFFAHKFACFNPEGGKDVIGMLKLSPRKAAARPIVPKGYVREVVDLGNFKTEMYRNTSNNADYSQRKLLLYHHGGAYITALSNDYRVKLKDYARACGNIDFCLPDYRVAPEHLYPAQAEDALANWDYLMNLGYRPQNIVIGGDSAGGNMTLTLMLRLRDMGKELPRGFFCMSPWGDASCSGRSYYDNYRVDIMFGADHDPTPESISLVLESDIFCYCRGQDRTDPYVSPVYGDYHDFPSTALIVVGGNETLLDDSRTVASKLQAAGTDVKLVIGEGMFHIYPMFSQFFPEAKQAFDQILDYVSKTFSAEEK